MRASRVDFSQKNGRRGNYSQSSSDDLSATGWHKVYGDAVKSGSRAVDAVVKKTYGKSRDGCKGIERQYDNCMETNEKIRNYLKNIHLYARFWKNCNVNAILFFFYCKKNGFEQSEQ